VPNSEHAGFCSVRASWRQVALHDQPERHPLPATGAILRSFIEQYANHPGALKLLRELLAPRQVFPVRNN
jgi:hypothetical protein